MSDRLSESARRVVVFAEGEAERMGHPQVGSEHLLVGLVVEEGTWAAERLSAAGVTVAAARDKVVEAVGPTVGGGGPLPRRLSARAQRALDRASRFSLQRGEQSVEAEDILAGVLDVEGRAGQVLRGLGVDVGALGEAVKRLRTPPSPPSSGAPSSGSLSSGSLPGSGASSGVRSSPDQVVPRCGRCHADLVEGLSHRTVTSREAGTERRFVVAFCSACGAAVSAAPTK